VSTGEQIVRLAGRGDGITADGRHVPMVAPGDVVRESGAHIRGPHYQTPPCPHYPQCGGCQLQHVDDASYTDFVADRVHHALVAQGIADIVINTLHLSPPHTRRRAALKARRLGREVRLGFNEAGSHNLVDVRACDVLHPALVALLKPLRPLLLTMMRDRGSAAVQLTLVDQGVDVVITGVTVAGLEAAEALSDFAARHRLARLALDEGDGLSTRWEPEAATMTLGGVPVEFPPGAFLQSTADGEAALRTEVLEITRAATQVADLFAGLGTFALPLSAHAPVHAVEGARDPVLALARAANGARRAITTEHRDLFRRPLTAGELARFDAVVIDPPRAGAAAQVAELAQSGVTCIAYVSCNPQTFARDARTLIDHGFSLTSVTPVGQFRWSTHVELIGAFSR
jgi:23S rRNA (uracil1939-C5)-methyltransferase